MRGHIILLVLSLAVPLVSRGQETNPPPPRVPPRSMREFDLPASPDARVLRVGGYFAGPAEGPLESLIQIWLNGILLDGRRLLGPAEATTPLMPVAYKVLFPRFDPQRMAFAFKQDADSIINNGPWNAYFFRERYATHHVGPFIQLDLSGLSLQPSNTVRLVNGHAWATFILSTLETAPEAVTFEEPLLPMPAYLILRKSPTDRALYERHLTTGQMSDVERAELLAAFGIADATTEGVPLEQAVDKLRRSLETAPDFPSRAEVFYRLAAAWVSAGSPPIPESTLREGIREAAGEWGDLARALLAARDGQPSSGRPVLSVPLVSGPARPDGLANEPFWADCPSIPLRHPMGAEEVFEGVTEMRAAAAANGLALLFQGTFDPAVKFVCGLDADSPVWEDNAIEVMMARDLQFRNYYELNVTLLGTRYDGLNRWRTDHDVTWTGPWQSATRLQESTFTVEYLIPWSFFDREERPPAGTLMVANLFRVWITLDEKGNRHCRFLSPVPTTIVDAHRLQIGVVFRLNLPAVSTP